MKDTRPGEELWEEWYGSGYLFVNSDSSAYYTFDHVDLDNEIVRRALASALQRDGISHSLGDGFKLIEGREPCYGWVGSSDFDEEFTVCDEHGETAYGDILDDVKAVTWLELVF
jgi:hypothetical protein